MVVETRLGVGKKTNKQCECVESSLLPVCSGVASVVRDFVQQVSLLTYCLAGQTKSAAVGRFVQP